MSGLTATTALPYNDVGRATAGLRGQLRLLAVDRGHCPAWTTFSVSGPTQRTDARGRTWFEWSATVETEIASEYGPSSGAPPEGRQQRT